MNKLVIPPCPNWFETNIFTCAVDNTVIYGSLGDLVVIYPNINDDTASNVRIISNAHERVVAVSTNNGWKHDSKLLVSIGDEKIVKMWDVNAFELINSHSLHKKSKAKLISVAFATDDRIVSVCSDGLVVLWRPSLNETITFNNMNTDKANVTCMSVCPHATWLVAFGNSKGIIIVADLRKSGKVLYNLRCYDTSPIISLSWCPTPFNIFPDPKRVILTYKSRLDQRVAEALGKALKMLSDDSVVEEVNIDQDKEVDIDQDKAFDKESRQQIMTELANLSLIEKSPEVVSEIPDVTSTSALESRNVKENPWINLKHADDDELNDSGDIDPRALEAEKNISDDFDFLSECTALKYRILNEAEVVESEEIDSLEVEKEIIVEDSHISVENKVIEACPEVDCKLLGEKSEYSVSSKKEFLLASSSKSGPIFIWRAGTDGRVQLELPATKSKAKPRRDNRRNTNKPLDKTWITILWIKPNILLSSSANGELLLWDLLKYKGNGRDHRSSIVHFDHRSLLFCISSKRIIYNSVSNTSLNDDLLTVWTTGQDRQIFETTLITRTCVSSYLTLAFVQCINSSTIDSNRLAMGHSDGSIILWNLSLPHTRRIVMNRFYHKQLGKITCLAWHPSVEYLLAYATSEGAIAILNTNMATTQGANSFLSSFFKTPVHKLQWGPLTGDSDKYALYACGEGKLVYYNTDNGQTAPVPIDLDEYITHMSWKPDNTTLAISTKSSAIMLLSANFEILSVMYVSQKTITNMIWHPTATLNSISDMSECCNWLAIGTRAGQCAVYNMICENDSQETSSLVHELNCHSKQILSISWSPYDDGKLITSSEDCTAQVWNVESGIITNSYISSNLDPIVNVLWSPLKENLIISTAKDVLEIWDYTEHAPIPAQDLDESLKSLLKLKNKYHTRGPDKQLQSQAKQTEESSSKKKTLLPILSKVQNDVSQARSDCRKLLENSQTDNDAMQLFGQKDDVLKMLTNQQKAHMKCNKVESAQHLSLWKGDMINTIKSSIDNGTVTPWLICMTPMISPQLWQEACRSYAKKQAEESEDSDPIAIASFYLACHDIESAVSVLADGHMFREAVALIKSRLVPDSQIYISLFQAVVEKWAIQSIVIGSYEIAAQCYLSLGNYDEAAKALFKRSDGQSLELAMDIANKGENDDLKVAIKTRLDMFVKYENSEVNLAENEEVSTKDDEAVLEELNNGPEGLVSGAKMEDILEDNKDLITDEVNTLEMAIIFGPDEEKMHGEAEV